MLYPARAEVRRFPSENVSFLPMHSIEPTHKLFRAAGNGPYNEFFEDEGAGGWRGDGGWDGERTVFRRVGAGLHRRQPLQRPDGPERARPEGDQRWARITCIASTVLSSRA